MTENQNGETEFDTSQERILRELGHSLRTTAAIAWVCAATALAACIGTLIYGRWGWALLPLLIGAYLGWVARKNQRAGSELEQIVSTSGQDMSHLMNALSSLQSLYRLKVYLVMILLGLVLFLAVSRPAV